MTRLEQFAAGAIKWYREILISAVVVSAILGFARDIRWFLVSGLLFACFYEMHLLVVEKRRNAYLLILIIWATLTLAATLVAGLIMQVIFPL